MLRHVPFTLADRVVVQGQRFRADETPTRMAITVRFLADRTVQRAARHDHFRQLGGAR